MDTGEQMLIIYGMYHFLSPVTQTLTLSVTDTSTRTYQWGLKRDVIIVTSLIRDLSDVPSVSVLERFNCTYILGRMCFVERSIHLIEEH